MPVFTHILLGTAHGIDGLAGLSRRPSFISGTSRTTVVPLSMAALVGGADYTFVTAFTRGWQDVLSLPRSIGIARFARLFSQLTGGAAELVAALGKTKDSSNLFVEALLSAIVRLAAIGYEHYRNWNVIKRILSRSLDLAPSAGARLLKWVGDKTGSTAAYGDNSIAVLTTRTSDPPSLTISATTAARAMSSARGVEHAAAAGRPVSMLRAAGRATAVAAFAAPVMLAQTPARVAFAAPLVSARVAHPLSTTREIPDALVVNYAPNVVIHSEHATDATALKGHVMEVLERHGRELHQVLAREIVRQQRRDF